MLEFMFYVFLWNTLMKPNLDFVFILHPLFTIKRVFKSLDIFSKVFLFFIFLTNIRFTLTYVRIQ